MSQLPDNKEAIIPPTDVSILPIWEVKPKKPNTPSVTQPKSQSRSLSMVTKIKNLYQSLKQVYLFNQLLLLCRFFFNPGKKGKASYSLAIVLDIILIVIIVINGIKPATEMISPLFTQANKPLESLTGTKSGYEVFGFAPYWTFNNLDNVDFETLTTMAYFGVEVDGEGNLDREGSGYQTFKSDKATEIFKKAHSAGTRVVLTITQMKNGPIEALMDSPQAQEKAITEAVAEVKNRGIDGINVDLEYTGNPGEAYRNKFSLFVKNLTDRMHSEVPNSRVTVSVYASAVKEPKIYDIKALGRDADGVFMMAYDFAVASSDNAIPTAPLYGHKEGKYWYDVSTAVDHFLAEMPSEKLILGVPWYGYNYAVSKPAVKAEVTKGYYQSYKQGRKTYRSYVPVRSHAQTYSIVENDVIDGSDGVSQMQTGWDQYGQVGYKSYYSATTGSWRMVFYDDPKSLKIKYNFAKDKNLAGVGMWALGFDKGKTEMWALLREEFGIKDFADSAIVGKEIR